MRPLRGDGRARGTDPTPTPTPPNAQVPRWRRRSGLVPRATQNSGLPSQQLGVEEQDRLCESVQRVRALDGRPLGLAASGSQGYGGIEP